MNQQHLRILDANFNRAVEASRVIEEHCRFGLVDTQLANQCKQLRHRISKAAASKPLENRFLMRDTDGDVGTELVGSNEEHRSNLNDLLAANFSRLTESLRVLEEYSKLSAFSEDSIARELEQCRYETYQLQKSVMHLGRANQQLKDCRLCLLTAFDENEEALIAALLKAGIDMVQLRAKDIDDRELWLRARKLRELTDGSAPNALMIVNDRPDIARMSRSDGIHVGIEDLPIGEVRKIVGPDCLIGYSTHCMKDVQHAVREGADYIGAGPTFPSRTKAFDEFKGTDYLTEIAANTSVPIFAIGGIDSENLPLVLETGVNRIAVSASILKADDPVKETLALKNLLTG